MACERLFTIAMEENQCCASSQITIFHENRRFLLRQQHMKEIVAAMYPKQKMFR
jgi:hypothetical protein